MPQSTSANNYILTLLDVFTKWPEAVYIKSKNAVDVALALYQFFLNMGFIRSDQGREFGKKFRKTDICPANILCLPSTNKLVVQTIQLDLDKMLFKMTSLENHDYNIKEALFA